MQKQKKIPMRMCSGCREMKPKRELVRVVRDAQGNVSLDLTSKAPGRGAYVCHSVECFQKARKMRAFERALSTEEIHVTISDEIFAQMEEALKTDG